MAKAEKVSDPKAEKKLQPTFPKWHATWGMSVLDARDLAAQLAEINNV